MPLFYDNNFKYSEATMTLVSVRDWTEEGVGVLSLWFRGGISNLYEDFAGGPSDKRTGVFFCSSADPELEYSLFFDLVQGRTLTSLRCRSDRYSVLG